MRVRHFGNTANNAFHNARILEDNEGIHSELPIEMFGLIHAISAPAWEVVDFDVPSAEWVSQPDWSAIPDAMAVNSHYTDLPLASGSGNGNTLPDDYRAPDFLPGLRRWVNGVVSTKQWARPLVNLRTRQVLSSRAPLPEPEGTVDIVYGADSVSTLELRSPSRTVVSLEHGTVRWIADGSPQLALTRRAFREQVQRSAHLWVTNLDPRTLEVAEDVMPGRWSVLPHPYAPDPRVPFAETGRREQLLAATRSSSLILLPSSQNWGKHHDKGSMKALTAFVELRRAGVDAGLVAVEWGLQLAESRAFLEQAGVAEAVSWVSPMARLSLQKLMADVDIVWDQFGLEAFGGLAMRAVEQGTPLVSRGLAPVGEQMIGGPIPWTAAATVDDIVRETTALVAEYERDGRQAVISRHRAVYRDWLLKRHSARITTTLQREVYEGLLDGSRERAAAVPDRWAQLLNGGGTDG